MTTSEFNKKYKDYLEEGHYGLEISDPGVIKYLDEKFKNLTRIKGFKYSQIKMKFWSSRFYSNLSDTSFLGDIGAVIENNIERDLNIITKYE